LSLEAATIASSRRDPPFAAEYLNTVLEDGDQQGLMIVLRCMAKESQEYRVWPKAKLNATTLYRTLSPQSNTELRSLTYC
jgi:DNA-binding phage protein